VATVLAFFLGDASDAAIVLAIVLAIVVASAGKLPCRSPRAAHRP
jgi:hypothetical protein